MSIIINNNYDKDEEIYPFCCWDRLFALLENKGINFSILYLTIVIIYKTNYFTYNNFDIL